MTFRGIFCLIFELLLLIMALGTDIREFLIVAVCIGGLWVYCLISMIFAVLTLKFSSHCDRKEIPRGEDVYYTLKVKGPVILPVVGKIKVMSPDTGDITDKALLSNTFLLSWKFRLNRTFNFKFNCAHTGYWNVGIKKLRVTDIFGMFSLPLFLTRKSKYAVKIAVTPQIYDCSDSRNFPVGNTGFTGVALQNSESGDVLSDSRNYQEGDALRRINWKLSVKTKKLHTRIYEISREPNVIIAIDTATALDNTGTIADIYRETTTTLTNRLIEENTSVKVITLRSKSNIRFNKNYREFNELEPLKYDLMGIDFNPDKAPLSIYRLNDKTFIDADKIFILTANPSVELLGAIYDVSEHGKEAYCIMPSVSDNPLAPLNDAIISTGVKPVVIRSVDEIAEKVGDRI